MKLAFIPSTFLPWVGGAEIQAHNTANKMVEIGNDVDIYLLDQVNIDNKKYKIVTLNKILINFVFLLRYYLNINFSFLLRFYFKKICENKKYDLWHFHSVNYKTLIYIEILKNLKQKVFITFQGADIQKDYEIKYGYRFDKKYENLLKKTILLVDGIFAISKNIEKDLNFFSYPPKKITSIPNSIEIRKIKEIKKKNIKDKKLKIITVARFSEKKKGLDIIEDIAKIFIDNNFDYEWTLVGRNSDFLLKSKFISENIKFFNIESEINNFDETYFPHSKLIKLYKQHDVYVNLARIESFGITMIEAIAADLPVVSFNTKGANEIVINNQNGYLIEKYEPLEMANFLMKNFNALSKNRNLNYSAIIHYDLKVNTQLTLDRYQK
jgi:glycosyltransferase involved in cell wall biosynthesis